MDYATLADKLKQGPVYELTQQREVRDSQRLGDQEFPYHLRIPANYDSKTPTPLYVYLHGGISRPAWRQRGRWWQDKLFPNDAFVLSPAAWRDAHWWSVEQVKNLAQLLQNTKASYNIDDNRIFVLGISDGGAGSYFLATRDITPYAGFVSIIGHPGVLYNPRANKSGPPPFANISNRPLFLINGAVDPLYPANTLTPYFNRLTNLGVNYRSIVQDDIGHDLDWNEDTRGQVYQFLDSHKRQPYPQHLYWETDSTRQFNRVHWLRVDQQAARPRACVAASYEDNRFDISSAGVRTLTLLLPDSADYKKDLELVVNGVHTQISASSPDIETLLHWHQQDMDRTALYGRTLEINIETDNAQTCRTVSAQKPERSAKDASN